VDAPIYNQTKRCQEEEGAPLGEGGTPLVRNKAAKCKTECHLQRRVEGGGDTLLEGATSLNHPSILHMCKKEVRTTCLKRGATHLGEASLHSWLATLPQVILPSPLIISLLSPGQWVSGKHVPDKFPKK